MSRLDLAALAIILAAALGFVALGVGPESLAAVAVAVGGLFTAWRTTAGSQQRRRVSRQQATRPTDRR
ncbi:hypothetical protein GCM10009661_45090 [Catellatospora chokoriensis]